jgi:hypothetical protein
MNAKERMLAALSLETPDRLPVTIHQWQPYHLKKHMGGMTALEAFQAVGLDASIAPMGDGLVDEAASAERFAQWQVSREPVPEGRGSDATRHTIHTPEGDLTMVTGANEMTTYTVEFLIKAYDDVDLVERYMPVPIVDQDRITAIYDETGDAGIVRGLMWGAQGGCWQHACCLVGTQRLIMETFDNPDWVHHLLDVLLQKKLAFIQESLQGARFDLIETGGGAGSDTVISPRLHAEFCTPYARQIHRALHDAGHRVVYHTCGGMAHIMDLILANEADATETLSPSSVGGNLDDLDAAREAFGGRMAMIGGMDQFNILTDGTPEQIRAEVRRLFEGLGRDGGYILSAADHFFETSPEKLRIYAEAAKACVY